MCWLLVSMTAYGAAMPDLFDARASANAPATASQSLLGGMLATPIAGT
jgi:hypothetical protein